jgi:hypothetical protein
MHVFAGRWMRKTKRRGVQGNARDAARVGQWSSVQPAVVDMVSTNGSACLSQMDAHLMRAASLKATFDESEFSQVFHGTDMSDGALAISGICRTASTPVAAVAHEPGFNALGIGPAADHGEITALYGMISKLLTQTAFGVDGPREHHEPACFVVKSVDGPNHPADLSPQYIGQSRGQKAPATRTKLSRFIGMTHRCQAGRLLYDDDMSVTKTDNGLVGLAFGHRL